MSDVFKAMCFRIVKSRVFWYALFFSFAFAGVMSLTPLAENSPDVIYGVIDNIVIIGFTIVMVLVCVYSCGDFGNKTIYYEIMNGHSRRDVYLGRLLALSLFAFILFNIQIIVSLILIHLLTNYNLFAEGIGLAVLKIITAEICSVAYIVFFGALSIVAKNMVVSISLGWFGIIASQLVVLFDNYEITSDGNTLKTILGSGAIKFAIADSFSMSRFVLANIISVVLIVAFYVIGLKLFKNSQLQ